MLLKCLILIMFINSLASLNNPQQHYYVLVNIVNGMTLCQYVYLYGCISLKSHILPGNTQVK